ncbi:MAG: DUF2062 domain-containing protein [Pseudomonadota bacterium]
MVFKRRKPLPWGRRITDAIYPRTGWRRAFEYFGHRLKRLPDSPHKIALGFSCGVFVSFSPLFGLHFLYAGLCALIVRGNVLAAFIGTFVGNPLTFPIFATASLGLGRWMFGVTGGPEGFASVKDSFLGAFSGLWQSLLSLAGFGEPAWGKLAVFWWEIFLPYFVGGILPGLIMATVFYVLARPLIAAYQMRRRSRMLARAQEKLRRKKAAFAKDAAAVEGTGL